MLIHDHILEALSCLVAFVFCGLTSLITLNYSAENWARKFLGLSYLAFGFAFAAAALTYSGLMVSLPHFYRTNNIFWLLCMPLSWLYIRTAVTRSRPGVLDLVHFLPLALYLIDYFPIFMLSGAEKAQLFRLDIANFDKMSRYGQGWLLPKDAQLTMRYLQLVIYWFLQVNLLFSASTREKVERSMLSWLKIYTLLELSLFLPFITIKMLGLKSNPWLSTISPAIATISSALALILNPAILYGESKLATAVSEGAKTTPHPPAAAKPTPDAHSGTRSHPVAPEEAKPALDPQLVRQIMTRLENTLQEGKPFLNPDYSLRELAEAIDIPSHKLSCYLSHYLDTNFNEYINGWRIRHCLQLMKKGDFINLNQSGIAARCGFNNRQTFSAAFKKNTGGYPSSFFNEMVES
jgi:AraC-like DNA-binding protein